MKHVVALAAIALFFILMFAGYQAIMVPVLSQVNPAAVIYFQVGADSSFGPGIPPKLP